jgi:hypothetical protein
LAPGGQAFKAAATQREQMMADTEEDAFSRHWKRWVFLLWLVSAAGMIAFKWNAIHWFTLGDTDDNMRLMQVRALLRGQDWYDLRQYRLNPPLGADIHWSRFVDLPIAGIILAMKPFFGGAVAEKIAVAVAPILPLGVAFAGLGLTVRRLVAPASFIIAIGIMLSANILLIMFMPLRIDHHGWQLALLTINIAGLADPKAARGGVTVGVASALSLVIGLEMVPWLAVSGAAVALRWIIAREEAPRLRGYGTALAGGTGAGFLIFASYANRVARCDALTPVWLSVMVLVGALVFAMSFARANKAAMRLLIASVAGVLIMAFFVLAWPDCLGRPEQVSPELEKLWLSNIKEARPLYTQSWTVIISVSTCLIGLCGNLWAVRKQWGTERGEAWAAIALLSVGSALLLVWQTRVASAAILFAIPGATALGWMILPRLRASQSVLVRTFGVVAAFLAVSGLWAQFAAGLVPASLTNTPDMLRVNKANSTCPTIPSLAPIARLPKATIFTFVDISPRLITLTHHNAIAGPYHRNGDAILDVQHAFRGTADNARAIIKRRGATMLLICPNLSESTIYAVQNPKGFYVQLVKGQVPDWLDPVALPKDSPFKLWRVR